MTIGLGIAAMVAMTACGPTTAPLAAGEFVASVEAEALAAMGIDPADIVPAEPALADNIAAADPSPTADATPGKNPNRLQNWRKRHALKVALRRNIQHGEAVVDTKKGPITVLVQRGVVTAIDAGSVTVKCADGFTLTWKFGEKLRVVERRSTIQASEVRVGAELAIAGAKDGDAAVARLIIIPLNR